jgi:hypothetical protein
VRDDKRLVDPVLQVFGAFGWVLDDVLGELDGKEFGRSVDLGKVLGVPVVDGEVAGFLWRDKISSCYRLCS